jgi:hypothetical protein
MLTTTLPPENDRLHRWERWGVVALGALVIGFGVLVEVRSAFMERRMGDLGCYLRAAWAVRTGENLYNVVEDNGWHYNYPPLYAVLLTPLADPPRGADAAGYVPYAVSVGVCYALNILWLAIGVHWLSTALESAAGLDERALRWSRRWWILRTTPVLVCLSTIGHTLSRGQTNLLLLMLVSGLAAGLMTGRRFRAGLCLAGAVCIKIFPAFLLLVPLWRRDGRCLAGAGVGLLVGLLLVPMAAMGPARTVGAYRDLARVLIGPALGVGGDSTRAEELIETTATDNQSFQSAMQASLHPDRDTRPRHAALPVRLAALGLGGVLTLLTLWAARGRRAASGPGLVLFVGCLTLIMLMLSPVCHSHYFSLELPLVATLLALSWGGRSRLSAWYIGSTEESPLGWGTAVLFVAVVLGNVLPQVPALFVLRDRGLPALTALLLWFVAWRALARQPGAEAGEAARPHASALAA